MNIKKEEIIDVEFFIVDDDRTSIQEKHIWVLVGENVLDANLAKISFTTFVGGEMVVNCFVSQIEGNDIKNAYDRRTFKRFTKNPTKEEQKKMVKDALSRHGLLGEIWLVGERYAEGHKSVLKLQNRIKGGAYVSV